MAKQSQQNQELNIDLSSLPDFEKSICLIITDMNGNKIAQSNACFSVCEAERIADAGVEEFLQVQLMPVKVRPGMKWDPGTCTWSQTETSKPKLRRATA